MRFPLFSAVAFIAISCPSLSFAQGPGDTVTPVVGSTHNDELLTGRFGVIIEGEALPPHVVPSNWENRADRIAEDGITSDPYAREFGLFGLTNLNDTDSDQIPDNVDDPFSTYIDPGSNQQVVGNGVIATDEDKSRNEVDLLVVQVKLPGAANWDEFSVASLKTRGEDLGIRFWKEREKLTPFDSGDEHCGYVEFSGQDHQPGDEFTVWVELTKTSKAIADGEILFSHLNALKGIDEHDTISVTSVWAESPAGLTERVWNNVVHFKYEGINNNEIWLDGMTEVAPKIGDYVVVYKLPESVGEGESYNWLVMQIINKQVDNGLFKYKASKIYMRHKFDTDWLENNFDDAPDETSVEKDPGAHKFGFGGLDADHRREQSVLGWGSYGAQLGASEPTPNQYWLIHPGYLIEVSYTARPEGIVNAVLSNGEKANFDFSQQSFTRQYLKMPGEENWQVAGENANSDFPLIAGTEIVADEFANDDGDNVTEDCGEERTDPSLFYNPDALFSWDSPGQIAFHQQGHEFRGRGNFFCFVRINLGGERVTGDGIQGSRASEKSRWRLDIDLIYNENRKGLIKNENALPLSDGKRENDIVFGQHITEDDILELDDLDDN